MINSPDSTNQPEAPDKPATSVGQDAHTLLYVEAIRYLNTLRKNFLIYPPGHIQVETSLKNGFDALKALFSPEKKHIIIGVLKEEISIDEETLNSAGPINREFAVSLKRHDIAAIIFSSDVEKEELGIFFKIITKTSETIEESGGIEKAVSAEASLKNIQVKIADFNKLFLTEETEISQPVEGEGETEADFSWKGFIGNLLSGTLSSKEGSLATNSAHSADPSLVAGLINDKKIDRTLALKHYKELLDSQIHKRGNTPDSPLNSEADDSLTLLLNGLNPELRSQFLSETLKSCSEADASGAEVIPIVEGLGENLVTEMLHLTNETGGGMSPSLLAFIGKISYKNTGTTGEEPGGLTAPTIEGGKNIPLSAVTNLFSSEKDKNTVEPEYRDVLDNLSKKVKSQTSAECDSFSLEEHLKTLEESHIDFQIARVLLSFIDTNVSSSIYADYSRQLIESVVKTDLREQSRFLFLSDAFSAFTSHVKEKPDALIRESAQRAIDAFKDQVFIAKVVHAYDALGADFGDDASNFLIQLGPLMVPEVLERYAGREGGEEKNHLYELLKTYKKEALTEARKHLNDLLPSFVSNIVVFIHDNGEKDDVSALRHLLQHSNLKVKTEAVAALLKFNSSWGTSSLKKMLLSDKKELQQTGIKLSGKFKVKEAVPELLLLISRVPLFESAFKKNEEVIKSLGLIGDPATLPVFEKLINYRVPFNGENVSHMKIVVFESLSGFPFGDIQSLVEKGARSPIYRIKQICNELKNSKRKKTRAAK